LNHPSRLHNTRRERIGSVSARVFAVGGFIGIGPSGLG
jgi:hypothetical protein